MFKFYRVSVSKCKLSTHPSRPCMTDAQINAYLSINDVFNFNYYYINTIMNAGDSDQKYLQEYLEDLNYFSFTPMDGINANLFISSYTIETDKSLWPVSDIRQESGEIVLDPAQTSIFQVKTGAQYMKLNLRKSPITVSISRSFKKIDETLSYIGGLFSFLLIFLLFVNKYNEYSFDLELTRQSYYCDKNQPFDSNFFNFLRFISFVIYRFLEKFNFKPDWPDYAKMNDFLEAERKQLDIRLITKKILLVQKLGIAILGKNQFQALMLSQPYTLNQAKEIRQSIKFYKRFIKKFPKKSDVQNDPIIATASYILSGKSLEGGNNLLCGVIGSAESIPREPMQESQNLDAPRRFQELGRVRYREIRHKQLFNNQLSMVKRILGGLQVNMAKGDKVAKRIWYQLDDKIKNTYNLLNKKHISLVSMNSINLQTSNREISSI